MELPPDEVARNIENALTAIDKNWSSVLVALVGVGIVTMAILQLFKDLFPTRRSFQRWWLRRFWLRRNATALGISRERADAALVQLITLATAGDEKALFNLPVEQLVGQLNAAAQALLDRPDRYPDLLRILAFRADPRDVRPLLKGKPTSKAELVDYVESRNSVGRQIQRSFDALQIAMGYRWTWILQMLSVAISATFIGTALTLYGGVSFWNGDRAVYAIAISIFGGFLAPVARDLFAAIQSLRGRAR